MAAKVAKIERKRIIKPTFFTEIADKTRKSDK